MEWLTKVFFKGYLMQVNLFLLKKDGTILDFSLPSSVTLIGRQKECDLCIPLSVVSRRHCEISINQNKLLIRDLHSKNGTLVNGQQVEDSHLNPGDRINFGPVTFVVQIDGSPAREAIVPLVPAAFIPAAPKQDQQIKPEDHFDEFTDELSDLHPGSSHTAEIPEIISDDLASRG
jgi:predicted component of type VI protein secretion system